MTDLLPANATALERNLAATMPLDRLPVALRTLWNAATCPVDLLPWLAWAWSVDDWDSTWSEAQKRDVIASSIYIHRHKGTKAAVVRATAAMGKPAQLSEWFEHDGAPYSFRLELSSGFASQADYDRFERLVGNAKNVRSLLERITRRLTVVQHLVLATVTRTASTLRINAPQVSPVNQPARLRLATVQQLAQHATLLPPTRNEVQPRATLLATILQTARITTIEASHG